MTALSVYFSSECGCLQVAPASTTELTDTQQPYPPTVNNQGCCVNQMIFRNLMKSIDVAEKCLIK